MEKIQCYKKKKKTPAFVCAVFFFFYIYKIAQSSIHLMTQSITSAPRTVSVEAINMFGRGLWELCLLTFSRHQIVFPDEGRLDSELLHESNLCVGKVWMFYLRTAWT